MSFLAIAAIGLVPLLYMLVEWLFYHRNWNLYTRYSNPNSIWGLDPSRFGSHGNLRLTALILAAMLTIPLPLGSVFALDYYLIVNGDGLYYNELESLGQENFYTWNEIKRIVIDSYMESGETRHGFYLVLGDNREIRINPCLRAWKIVNVLKQMSTTEIFLTTDRISFNRLPYQGLSDLHLQLGKLFSNCIRIE